MVLCCAATQCTWMEQGSKKETTETGMQPGSLQEFKRAATLNQSRHYLLCSIAGCRCVPIRAFADAPSWAQIAHVAVM